MKRISNKGLIIFIFLFALAIRLIYLEQIRTSPFFENLIVDAEFYDKWAQNIAKGALLGKGVFFMPPLYAYFLAAIYKFFGRSIYIAVIIQMLLGSLSCVMVYLLGKRLFNKAVGFLAAIIIATYGVIIFYEAQILRPTLAIFLTTILLLLLSYIGTGSNSLIKGRFSSRLSSKRHCQPPRGEAILWLFTGFCLGLLILVRENALLCIPFLVGGIIFAKDPKTRLVPVVVFLLGVSCVLMPVTLRNLSVGKDFVLVTYGGGQNFFIGNNPKAKGSYIALLLGRQSPEVEARDAIDFASKGKESGKELKPSQISWFWYTQGFKFIREEPFKFIQLLGKKFILFWNSYEIDDTIDYYFFKRYSQVLRLPLSGFGLIAPLGLLGVGLSLKLWRPLFLFYLFGISWVISIVLVFVLGRYRLPLIPVLAIFSGYSIYRIAQLLKQRSYKDLIFPALLFIVLFILLNLNIWPGNLATSHLNLAHIYREQGKFDLAISEYKKALEEKPDYLEASNSLSLSLIDKGLYEQAIQNLNDLLKVAPYYAQGTSTLGTAYERKGEDDKAIEFYKKSLSLDPRQSSTHNNLGNVYLRKGLLEQAIEEYELAIKYKPDLVPAYNNLGIIYKRKGQFKEAIEVYKKALDIDERIVPVHINLGNLYKTMGMNNEARLEFEKALKLDPNLSAAKEGLLKVKEGLTEVKPR